MQDNHPDEKTGWKLPDDEIPWLTFDDSRKMPSFPPAFEDNWKSYYEWRGLPLKSPAALLLHWPLSVYRILEKLKLTPDPTRRTIGGDRESLLVHYIGAEEELDYLPMYVELRSGLSVGLRCPLALVNWLFSFQIQTWKLSFSESHLICSCIVVDNSGPKILSFRRTGRMRIAFINIPLQFL